ncbi:MAG: extracellular solute-binding protein, partial [Melioribacteraceae bacterium]
MKKLTGAIVIIFLFVSCSNQKENKTEITFWHSFVSNTIPALNEIIELYEKENPGVKVLAQYVPSGDPLIQKLVTAIQSRTTPDIAWVHSDFLDKLVTADAIYKMNYFINGANGLSE